MSKHRVWSLQPLEAPPLRVRTCIPSSAKVFCALSFLDILITSESSFLHIFYIFKQYIKCKAILILFPLSLAFVLIAMDDRNLLPVKQERTRETSYSNFFLSFSFFSNCSYHFQKFIKDIDPWSSINWKDVTSDLIQYSHLYFILFF